MVIQSSAVSAVVLLIWAIAWAITPPLTLNSAPRPITLDYLAGFSEQISFIVVGMAPTVMVARIARIGSMDPNGETFTDHTDIEF
ncbi:hypothetical protein HYPSUDRAFT_206927 [Hypholoma sublateritium FD-334 SS-4]|uniref:Uncharacterized protein n=1 Tax=Hypholoma sublateritium (strain FD-334 SS-4) TaxID=945553 RepID=A0A0D2NBJ4_HYPSF|nr:hypothetical protein HYPSUDRAFT_206927 [Hypholoma sublateritium FD-334 SS-4]